MKTGLYISGIAHAVLILWLLFGGWLMRMSDDEPLQVTDVTILTEAEFAALSAPAPAPPRPIARPEPAPDPEPAPEPQPEPEPAPVPVPEPAPEPAPEPQPEPEPEPEPDPLPVEEAAPAPAPRVAPVPVPAPETPVIEAPVPDPSVAPTPAPEAETRIEETPEAAPEAATTEIVTEADEPSEAPLRVARPRKRPDRARPAPTPEPEAPAENAVNAALSEALAEPETPAPARPVPTGPPLTRGEKDALRLAVGNCWNLGSASTDAMRTTVVVLVKMAENGKPKSIEMLSSEGPNQAAITTAFDAARRAIIRCGVNGYNLPSEKYSQWQEIEMTFNPEKMRIK